MEAFSSDNDPGQKLLLVAGEKKETDRQEATTSNHTDNTCSIQDVHHERTPLIRPRRPGDLTDDDGSSASSFSDRARTYGAVPRRKTTQPESNGAGLIEYVTTTLSTRSVSVMSLLLIVVVGIVLTAASNLNTNPNGVQVKPRHVLVYIMFLMTVFVVWINITILPQKIKYSSRHDGALIPSHLLTGIGIFGMVCAVSQMLLFVDFVKCRRHVKNLSAVYGMYPFFKALFVYFQIYFFYKLSTSGIRDRKVPGGDFFIMVTLATNMCIWGGVFLNDASKDPRMEDVTWLSRHYYGVHGSDPCANATITSPQAKQLHDIVSHLGPYIAAFSMEYALLASGLLLHVWLSIKAPQASRAPCQKQNWTLWRLGFILGLLSIPLLFAAFVSEITSEKFSTGNGMLYGFESIVFIVLAAFSWYSIALLNKTPYLVTRAKTTQLEVILLGISLIGFPILDLCFVFASVAEAGEFPAPQVAWYAISSVAELASVGLQFLFIKKAYEYKLPEVAGPNVRKAAKIIRQFASFALVVNFGFWAAKTYELRRATGNIPTISEKFYGKYAWFGIGHLCYPLCIFFHFHVAICFTDVISLFSQFGPLDKSG